ncbi:MAG: NADP transhydrogenase subunit alpha [Chloroflexi bacterium]|nr:MAG: NADP transhydrogenase subunit alpha [Chloroflexota bacterium]MBL1193657.1 NADP transhydrogenase subunit alpha [Chloroflexota bacterium]NOH10949.1 NADP transhydrogenase subunit alpha [Chloroflexota bacterium]
MSKKPVFAILGAGNGGFVTAADLTLRGYEVRLFELAEFAATIEPILENDGIALRGIAGEGLAMPTLVSSDIEKTLDGADVILVIVPSMGHREIARVCAPYLKPEQIVVLIPGNFGGVLEFRQELLANGGTKDVTIAETTSLMFAAKKEGTNGIWARGLKQYLPLAAFPASRTDDVLAVLNEAYPQFVAVANVMETSLNNLNPIVHPAAMLTNVGFIESQRVPEWYFYKDGYTQGAGHIADQMDNERLALLTAFGLPEISATETLHRFYGHQGMNGDSLYSLFSESPVHSAALGPKSSENRMLSEDIPYGLVPYVSLAKMLGSATPMMDAAITMASVVNQTDYRKTGRTVETLGLAGMSVQQIQDFVNQ